MVLYKCLYEKVSRLIRRVIIHCVPEIRQMIPNAWFFEDSRENLTTGIHTSIYSPYHISDSHIGDYSYVATNSYIGQTRIGKFCSIGPNFMCGWGIHPTNTLSTHPMFYSTMKQNGMTLSKTDKIVEREPIVIGNDVFIGANVTVLDGVTIGNGAIIGAGAVVSKNIPDFAIAVGCPIRIIKYRFTQVQQDKLNEIRWWDFSSEQLKDVESMLFDIDGFIKKRSEICDS